MPRSARKKSESGIYHIVLRGINKQTVFCDDEDKEVFLNRLKLIKAEKPYMIYAFCMMSNHVHLLIKEVETDIGKIFQKILCSYVFWYNRKYERIGNLFQDRFKSEVITGDAHLLCAVRYIHRNPLKAKIEKEIGEYKWSSYEAYINDKESFVETGFILSLLHDKEGYVKFMQQEEDGRFSEFDNIPHISDEKLLLLVERLYKKYKVSDILKLGKGARDELLAIIRKIPGTSIRQISRVTGVSIMIVRNAK